ncbi:MAG TPA: 6-pyruvoyl-tetrahydropterin synthase-related protein, partial [Candidatus Eisenbacteria bacterium]|nr:6-pyruvoyl-tetrahydropterin synthase-related protein [Candidatus Eisenbacteria bacterium]
MKNKVLFFLIPILLLGICVFALLPLFHAGLFSMHDDEQVARLQQMYLVLSQGQLPPRWIPDLGFGFGYPLFNFYPPLVYYVGSFIHLFGFSFVNSTKIVFGLGFVFAALAMFLWVRKHYGIIPGLFAAILYTYAPYHSVDIYVRGALSEFFSWIFIPLILLVIDLLFEKREKKYSILLGIFFGLLMLSHTLVMLQFGPLLLVYLGFSFLQKKNRTINVVMQLLLGFGLGLGLTAYFWLPSILEKQYTLVDAILTKELASYAIHFVCPIQLWSGIWGYGGSAAGCLDGLSFQIGKVQAFVGGLGIVLSVLFLFKRRLLVSTSNAVLFICSIFLVLPYSKFLWDIAMPFWYIQFPWRYLLFVAVFSAFLGGFVLSMVEKRFGKFIAIILGLVLSLVAVFQVRNYFQPQAYRMITDAQMTSKDEL